MTFSPDSCLTFPFNRTNIEQKTPVEKAQNSILKRALIFAPQRSKIELDNSLQQAAGLRHSASPLMGEACPVK